MKRMMTDFAFAGSCGLRAASGLTYFAARACSSESIAANASEPKPLKASVRNSRRLRVGFKWARRIIESIHVKKIVQQEHGQSELRSRIPVQKGEGRAPFRGE